MTFDGTQVQNQIYISGESPWPVGADEWESRAEERLEPGPFGYIAGGAGAEATMRANREAFEREFKADWEAGLQPGKRLV